MKEKIIAEIALILFSALAYLWGFSLDLNTLQVLTFGDVVLLSFSIVVLYWIMSVYANWFFRAYETVMESQIENWYFDELSSGNYLYSGLIGGNYSAFKIGQPPRISEYHVKRTYKVKRCANSDSITVQKIIHENSSSNNYLFLLEVAPGNYNKILLNAQFHPRCKSSVSFAKIASAIVSMLVMVALFSIPSFTKKKVSYFFVFEDTILNENLYNLLITFWFCFAIFEIILIAPFTAKFNFQRHVR